MFKKIIAITITLLVVVGFIAYYRSHTILLNNDCRDASRAQIEAYKADKLANAETLDKYKVPVYTGKLSELNLQTSSKEARLFRTWINAKIGVEGINFAGHYSLVYIGMTGWGENYFLVDRITGKGISVPFLIGYIKTQPDSSLLLINPKDLVYSNDYDTKFACEQSVTGNYTESNSDLRPYYYNWNGSEFIQLGDPATINPFWKGYF